ncbi:MAG: hypothetical protein J3K34DRAFT_285904 [Monoraphidium minutum]|nr:MAG: hypothetical protein J3K34DRAFT_285904 [Monoraphidium minutum]
MLGSAAASRGRRAATLMRAVACVRPPAGGRSPPPSAHRTPLHLPPFRRPHCVYAPPQRALPARLPLFRPALAAGVGLGAPAALPSVRSSFPARALSQGRPRPFAHFEDPKSARRLRRSPARPRCGASTRLCVIAWLLPTSPVHTANLVLASFGFAPRVSNPKLLHAIR